MHCHSTDRPLDDLRTCMRRASRRLVLMLALGLPLLAPPGTATATDEPAPAVDTQVSETINTLNSLIGLQGQLRDDIEKLNTRLEAAQGTGDKKEIQAQLDKLDKDLQTTTKNLKEIASGADITSLRATEETKFDFQAELFSLLRPALKEMKEMTIHVRQKSDLKDKIAYYSAKLPVTERAVANITRLLQATDDAVLEKNLQGMLADWNKQLTFMQSELQSAELQLEKLERSEATLAEASQSYLKSFFQARGLYLIEALLVIVGILLISRLSYAAMVRLIPGYRAEHRSFRLRLLDLLHRLATTMLVIIGPMVVFYLVEDWVLFSLGILLLIGLGLTLRHALPRYWQQIQLFLNIGSVREGERIDLDGLPWRVRQINIFSILENPTADICQRVRIDSLVDLKSRPYHKNDPWFPCVRGDWVLLSDGMRGKVVGITQELVELVARGGAHRTYQTGDFLSLSPLNLSRNFRLKETIGISYNLQKDSVTTIPALLRAFVAQRIEESEYASQLLNLRVEFQQANTSSLDLVVIADFDGALADLYNRLRRTIQGWCVEACTTHHWEIPFTQVTLHQAEAGD
ncbi:MAG TPA: hypothetical protein VM011_03450 [Gammaproteobacteria bacterium]|nr:hypothetical protein [Gammaproteobacteria bacterium]